jgi:hypothetical protein
MAAFQKSTNFFLYFWYKIRALKCINIAVNRVRDGLVDITGLTRLPFSGKWRSSQWRRTTCGSWCRSRRSSSYRSVSLSPPEMIIRSFLQIINFVLNLCQIFLSLKFGKNFRISLSKYCEWCTRLWLFSNRKTRLELDQANFFFRKTQRFKMALSITISW